MGVTILTITSVSSALCHLPVFQHTTIVRNGLRSTSVSNSLKLYVSYLISENKIFRWKMKTFSLLFCYYCPHRLTVGSLNIKRWFHKMGTEFILEK